MKGEFDEYLKAGEPSRREKAYAWATAIGLQQVDQLTPSAYLIQTAKRNIEGEITLAESRELVNGYHKAKVKAASLSNRYLLVGGWEGDPTSNPTSNLIDPTSNSTVKGLGFALSEQVQRLLSVVDGEMSRAKLMSAVKLKDRVSFTNLYLSPALKLGLIEMTQPDSPRSPTQRYRLTAKGKKLV